MNGCTIRQLNFGYRGCTTCYLRSTICYVGCTSPSMMDCECISPADLIKIEGERGKLAKSERGREMRVVNPIPCLDYAPMSSSLLGMSKFLLISNSKT